MSEENENIVQNNDASPDVDVAENGPSSAPKEPSKFALFFKSLVSPPKRLSDIDWSKKTPKNKGAWEGVPPQLKADWVIWHEIRVQNTFATIAVLLEIASVAALIGLNGLEAGMIALLVVATIIAMTITIVFRKLLYKVLRVFIVGLIPAAIAVGAIHVMLPMEEGDSTAVVCEVLAALIIYGIVAFLEFKGKLSRKHPKFVKPKRPKAPSNPNAGYGSWLSNTLNAWDKDGVTNTSTNPRPKI
ncbi:MAG: hypothetical protein SPM09_11980 [Fibrobacter sp.]|uniref:hypothetical protein n=1 Tax=Fibrobacter sp. TaxID=35828 RepID=UPI002A915CDE|nr:hypothetical protein [Fibrobacter sp.]MDY6265119.1 hypothetical protein [Fibrobacter sp.]